MKIQRIISLIVCLFFCYYRETAWAVESFKPIGPIGGTDIRQAYLPPPGLYGIGVGVGLTLPKYWGDNDTFDSRGTPVIGGGGLLYVYDADFLGGKIASTVFESYADQNFGIKGAPRSRSVGFGDVYSDIFMWSRFFPSVAYAREPKSGYLMPYGLQVMLGLGMNFPTGKYHALDSVNVGSNIYTFSPNAALTYTRPSIFYDAPGHATEFSARFFFNIYTKNHATGYLSGPTLSADFAITERVEQWQFGVAGTTYTQVADDTIGGNLHPNNGNRASFLSLGPLISYDFVAAGRYWNLTAKGLLALAGRNTVASSGVVVRLVTNFK
ncbi:SphA family protein [Burkholderia gladioli]|uniref:SphA family protein n=1 Tax=Burkholderia gladioli TaxID=28095 RepID=UPI000F80CF2B|nr:transporter [Burkholderia gladioli]